MKIGSIISLLRNTSLIRLKKGEILIPAGSSEKEVFFIRRGLIRSYYSDEDKFEEITFQLYAENSLVLNVHTFLLDEPSKFCYRALEDTKVYKIGLNSFIDFTSNDPQLLELNRRFLGRNAMRQAFQRVESFVFLSPEERYQKYVEDHPNIINRAPDKYIANILGITPVSLSRIRSRIASKRS
jgi:CRP-like cAMP-binding protein